VHHIAADGDAKAIVDALMEPLAPGSHVVITLNTTVIKPENMRRAAEAYNAAFGNPPIYLSSPDRIAALFGGFELVDPGVVTVTRWKPDPATDPDGQAAEEMDLFVGVARKS
ncbi:SAM-dependent methyltransferase, partial [Actinomadura adrarensis]